MQNFPCLAVLFQCFFPVLRTATFFFIYFFRCSLYHLVVMHREIKSRDSFQVLECLKTIPSSPNSARTPSPTFLNERKCHSEIWSSSSQRISEHCWVCDLISHIGHAREKTFPIIKISWKPGTCKPRWDFVELWLVILKQIQFGPILSLLFSWWQIFNQHAVFSVNLRVKDSSQDISPVLGLNFSLQCHRNFRSVYQGDSLSLFEKINICNEKSAWYSLKCDLLRHLRRQKSEKKNKQTRKR